MKWGQRKQPNKLSISKKDSSTTKKVKNDYNSLSNDQFKFKYLVSKKRYAKRVDKYEDPYKHALERNKKYKNMKISRGTSRKIQKVVQKSAQKQLNKTLKKQKQAIKTGKDLVKDLGYNVKDYNYNIDTFGNVVIEKKKS